LVLEIRKRSQLIEIVLLHRWESKEMHATLVFLGGRKGLLEIRIHGFSDKRSKRRHHSAKGVKNFIEGV